MYLHKLTIFGFKSFAKKTEMTFSKGLSAIVGPNGCGKTNILDAIRWVIGEQKVKALRSSSMRDVIFKGSREHKPLNMAEVQLTIRECKGLLPYDPRADTVILGRRLYRSGDSEYLINGNSVRLKDIQSVLMGTGIGSSIYALIEQSMIQRILAGGKDDRRELLEEAAGIMKYKVDRKASESKLRSTETDLERLEDILGEVRKNVNSLKRQMRRSKDLQRLKQQSKNLAIKIAATRYDAINKKRDKIDKELGELEQKLAVAQAKHSELDATRQSVSVERDEREKDVSRAGEKLRKIESRIAEKEKNLAINSERKGHVDEGLQNSRDEVRISKERLSELEKLMVKAKDEIKASEEQNRELKDRTEELVEKQSYYEDQYRDIRKFNVRLREDIQQARKTLSQTDTGIGSMEGQLESIDRQMHEAESAVVELEGKIGGLADRIEEMQSDLDGIQQEYDRVLSELNDIQREIEAQDEKRHTLDDRIGKLESGISGLKGRLDALRESSAPDTTEEKVEALIGKRQDVLGRMSEVIRPGKLPAPALDRILGEMAEAWIIQNSESAAEISKTIKEAELSTVLVVLEELPETTSDNAVVPDDMSRLLYFVKDFDLVERDTEKSVAEDGSYLRTPGVRRIGAPHKGAISFAEEIEKLEDDLKDMEMEIVEARREREELLSCREKSQEILNDLNKHERELLSTVRAAEDALHEVEYERKSLINRKEDTENRLKLFSARKKEVGENLSELQRNREKLSEEVSKLENDISKRSIEEDRAEKAMREWTKKCTEAQMKYIQAKGELESLQKEMDRLRMQYRAAEDSIDAAERRITELQSERMELNQHKNKLSEEIEKLVDEKEVAEKEFDGATETAREINEKLRKIDVQLRDASAEVNELDKTVHEKRMEIYEQELQAEFISENLKSDYGENIEEIELEELLSPEEERKAKNKLERLKVRISDFGGVNPEAEIEYDKEKERYDFLTAQREDLVEAKNNLKKTIRKLNNTARRQFLETFEETRRHFKNIFAELFEGGEADLTLQEGEDVLEADIEISARPPGKRFLMINQLSQGEKALCAVSLLFGLYKVKPSPFCMLDEVDAPLDDANVGRFLRMLKRFTGETQFILITHNKRTMEATDFLYGITMQEDGVSKAISLKMSDLTLDFENK